MELKLNQISVECIIGDLPFERVRPQLLQVDVELNITDSAADTDSLADTVDYAALVVKIREMLIASKCRLIERAAKLVHEVCLGEKGVHTARVSVTKSGAVPDLASATAIYGAL